jgi:uncharacterized membrane protein YeaQ/YmgE (transglycosylase-associated protein family)
MLLHFSSFKCAQTNKVVTYYIFVRAVLLLASIFNIKNKKIGDIMNIINLIIFLAVGALAGWLAGNIMKGRGFGLIGDIIVGIFGAIVGGFVFGLLGITTGGLLGAIIMATIGAVLFLYLLSMIKKA